jgi:hypothetical protein
MDISDLTNEIAHGRTMADTASFLCRDEDEVRQKAKELGLQEHPGRRVRGKSIPATARLIGEGVKLAISARRSHLSCQICIAECPSRPHIGAMIRLLHSTAGAALLVLVAGGAVAADTGKHRGAQGHGWTTHRSVSRPASVTSPQPGLTVLHRQFLDDINARSAGDALRYVPGVIVR